MLDAAAGAFTRMGAAVIVRSDGENFVRTVAQSPAQPDAARAEVFAQGLPNLLHELVHAVLAGRVADDHGIDYRAIPFDLDAPEGRTVLWEELSCSLLSCAYLRDALIRRETLPRDAAHRVDAWFREQVEIQPVFYGMEDAPGEFLRRVRRLLQRHEREAAAVTQRAYEAVAAALANAGAPEAIAIASTPESLPAIWARAWQAPT